MNMIKPIEISELPIREDITIRIKILEFDDQFMTFLFRTPEKEFTFMIEIPKNKYWKSVKLQAGKKINVKISKIGKNKNKQLIRVG